MVILICTGLVFVGLCLGSFVNAFVWRFHEQAELADSRQKPVAGSRPKSAKTGKLSARDLSITRGRSMCPACHHALAPKDLIPLASYLWLRGKCRYCHQPIPDTPLAELAVPLLFAVSYIFWPANFSGAGLVSFGFWLVFAVGFVILAIYDIRWYELPHRIVLPLIGLAALQVLAIGLAFPGSRGGGWPEVIHAGWGAGIGGGLFLLLYVFSPKQKLDDGSEVSKWIGGGDITLGLLLGLLVGGPGNALLLIFVASLLGTLLALPLLAAGRVQRSSLLPFGPFLLAAAVIVRLWGAAIISWYLNGFLS